MAESPHWSFLVVGTSPALPWWLKLHRRWWALTRMDLPWWRQRTTEQLLWPAWRQRRWERKLAPEIASWRAREAQDPRVVPAPISSIKRSHRPGRIGAAWRWTLYRTPLTPVLARTRFEYRRLRGRARADGRNYVGWTVQVGAAQQRWTNAPPVGAVGVIRSARYQLTSGEYEHNMEFPGGQWGCGPLPREGLELIPPEGRRGAAAA